VITFSIVPATLCETICSLSVAPLSARLDKNIIQRSFKKMFQRYATQFWLQLLIFLEKVFKVVARDQSLSLIFSLKFFKRTLNLKFGFLLSSYIGATQN
jgi:hypothetical protein